MSTITLIAMLAISKKSINTAGNGIKITNKLAMIPHGNKNSRMRPSLVMDVFVLKTGD